jgi:pyrroloquinoline quinone biosynthesis protein E
MTDSRAPRPFTLVAELTYRCPLRCAYCSNPAPLERAADELDTATWRRVLVDAQALGVVQVHFTGGEPLTRPDLEELVLAAHDLGLYSNLVTSALPLDRTRLAELRARGLDAVQISLQGARESDALRVAGRACLDPKLRAARCAVDLGIPLTVNVVLHRDNIGQVPALVALAHSLGAFRIELANAQYLGWALENRRALLPTSEQIERARRDASEAREKYGKDLEILFVLPDYDSGRPRACMDGWGSRYVVVSPTGTVLPCHAARSIPMLSFENVRDRCLREIWRNGPALEAFRGDAWMEEPCRSCRFKAQDFGGCRCQAFLLTGDPRAADPACRLSPFHDRVASARAEAARAAELLPLRLRSFRD